MLASFCALVVFIAVTDYSDYDFWWHLRLGELAFTSGHIAAPDTSSYTFAGRPQLSIEWLADIVIYLSYAAGGLWGCTLLKISVLLATFFLLFSLLKAANGEDDASFFATLATLVVVLYAIRFRLFVRPFMFSYLFFAGFLFLIDRFDRTGCRRYLYVLPVMEVLWANMSKFAFFGPLLIFIFFAAGLLQGKRRPEIAVLFIATVACSFINPSTYKLYTLPFDVMATKGIAHSVGEHQPMSFGMLWGYGLRYTLGFQVLAVGVLISLVMFWRRLNYFQVFLTAAFFFQALRMVRLVDFFSFSAAVPFSLCLAYGLRRVWFPLLRKRALPVLFPLAILAAIPLSVINNKTYSFGSGIKADVFPEKAVEFLDAKNITGRLFNSYPFGGYIMWRTPSRKVFIDGRGFGALYSTEFFNDYFEIVKSPEAWRRAEKRWGFDYAVIEYSRMDMGRHFPMHLRDNPEWALVYWDNASLVYLKRNDTNRAVIEEGEYRIVRPNFYDLSYLMAYLHSKKDTDDIIASIDREIALNPANQEPRLAKAFLLFNMGQARHDEALKEVESSLGLKPDLAMEHSAHAFLLVEKGRSDQAREEVKMALSLDPNDAGAKALQKQLGM